MAQTGIHTTSQGHVRIASTPSRFVRRYACHLPLAFIAALVAAYACRLIAPPTLWLDEAMLYVNVRDISWSGLFSPLPFYDQASPVAYTALLKLIHIFAGLNEALLRLPSWLALIATFTLIARLPDTNRTVRIFTAALLAGSFVTARIVTDAKPYMLEAMFAFALLSVFHPRASGLWRHPAIRLILLVAAMLATTAFPLVAFAVGAPLILGALRDDVTTRRAMRQWRSLRLAAVFTVALFLYAVYFAACLQPALNLLAANHAYAFGQAGYAPEDTFYIAWLHARLLAIVHSHWPPITLAVILAIIAGLYVLSKRTSIYVAQFAALLAIVVAANLSGHFPVMEERFSVFLLPWLTLLAATGCAQAIALLKSKNLRVAATISLTALTLMPALATVRDPFHQQARRSLGQIHDNPEIPLVTTMSGQPIVDAYSSLHDAPWCDVTAAGGTTNRCTAPKTAHDGDFTGPATKWYLMNYIAVTSWGGSAYAFPGASIEQFSSDYYDWIVASLRRHEIARLLIMQGNPKLLARIKSRLQPGETLRLAVDERPPSPTFAHGAAQLYEFRRQRR